MLEKDFETRTNIIGYCKDNDINDRDMFYLLHAFHVDTTEDFLNMINYIKQGENCASVSESKSIDEPTKIYIFNPKNKQPKKD